MNLFELGRSLLGKTRSASTSANSAATGAMGTVQDREWDDNSREDLRGQLSSYILGELRLAKNDDETILRICREVQIEDACPESERSTFEHFATEELLRRHAAHESEMAEWPTETDCDRLDRVEAKLLESGIVLWQASPCCDTCTCAEVDDRIASLNSQNPGLRDRVRGYAFFIDQNMPEMLSDSTELQVYLGYGWLSPDRSDIAQDAYEVNALGIGHEVCKYLQSEGLIVNWDGSFAHKIGVSVNWQRRSLLA